jgi:hypothetical protein
MTDRKTYYNSPGDRPKRPMPRPTGGTITRGTPEQGADMYKRQQEQRRKQEEEARKRALKIDPDNYTPSRD